MADEPKTCATCRFFADYRDTEGDDWANGYCMYDYVTTGFAVNEYGGRWTNDKSTCPDHELLAETPMEQHEEHANGR